MSTRTQAGTSPRPSTHYVRYSRGGGRDGNAADQIAAMDAALKRGAPGVAPGAVCVGDYADHCHGGSAPAVGPVLRRLLDYAAAGHVVLVVARSPDRISRDPAVVRRVRRRLRGDGVRLLFTDDLPQA